MKRLLCALLVCALLLPSLTGCLPRRNTESSAGNESYTAESTLSSVPSAESSESSQEASGESSVETSEEFSGESSDVPADSSAVSSALEDGMVAVTIPADFFRSVQLDTLVESAKRLGMENYHTNEDGSVTFYMTEETHRQVDEYTDALNHRYTAELDYAYMVGFQTAFRMLLLGLAAPKTVMQHFQEVAEE